MPTPAVLHHEPAGMATPPQSPAGRLALSARGPLTLTTMLCGVPTGSAVVPELQVTVPVPLTEQVQPGGPATDAVVLPSMKPGIGSWTTTPTVASGPLLVTSIV